MTFLDQVREYLELEQLDLMNGFQFARLSDLRESVPVEIARRILIAVEGLEEIKGMSNFFSSVPAELAAKTFSQITAPMEEEEKE